jgi:hypothetical protein
MGHGVGLRAIDAAKAQPPTLPPLAGVDPKYFAGFSYLLGDPKPEQRSSWGEDLAAARKLFLKLSSALPGEPSWQTSLQPGVDRNDNPFIPSGYTYLLQFIAHDMVQTSVPFWAAADLGVDSENCRGTGLILDALYGGGPVACPAAYEPADAMDENRFLLRLGRVATSSGASAPHDACPFRDLARVNIAKAFTNGDSVNFDNAYQLDVADARNDDTVILTQLTVLFTLAHNIIAENVQSPKPEAKFAYARAAMLAIYYAIIRCDVLPRLLHPDIWRVIKDRPAESRDWLWRQQELPVEFSHGAFRVGHAMVRPKYNLNDALFDQAVKDVITHNRPPGSSHRTPLELRPNWIVQWSYFFNLTRVPNFSIRIGPTRTSLDLRDLFPTGEPGSGYTSFRDYLSAAAARMWSIDALIRTISERSPALIPPGWCFSREGVRRSVVANWLRNHLVHNDLGQDEIERLSCDPPLPLFVLLEAGLDLDPRLQGRCMGVLGSTIVAEVMCKRIAEEQGRLAALRAASLGALPADLWAEIVTIDSMPELVNFVARHRSLSACGDAPFI